ncbi:hypothetical protein ES707_14268 [subsurface metagenome]
MKNKKEIDMVVKELKSNSINKAYTLWQMLCHYANFRERMVDKEITDFANDMVNKIANSILTKLKENEIVLVKGKVKRSNYNVPYFTIVESFGELELIFRGNLTSLKGLKDIIELEGKNIILTARVVKEDKLRKLKEKDYWAIQKFPGKYRKVMKDEKDSKG